MNELLFQTHCIIALYELGNTSLRKAIIPEIVPVCDPIMAYSDFSDQTGVGMYVNKINW